MTTKRIPRRRFLQASAGALAAPVIIPSSVLGKTNAPGNRISIGLVGLGSKGTSNLSNFLRLEGAQVVAVCDVDREHSRDKPRGTGRTFGTTPARQLVEKFYADKSAKGSYKGCDTYSDFRELCARDDIDAVVVSTPDHWHALITLEALRNGKDVYCEKPVTHLFAEGQAVYREAAKQGAIFQTGSQQRSDTRFRVAAEIVLNGLIGKVQRVEVGLPTGHSEPIVDDVTPREPPEGLDYDLWCGPSEKLPYIFARHHRNWRWHLAYGGGQIMDWIGHHNDIAHWGLGMDESGPVEVEAVGWTLPETKVYNAPVSYEIRCKYPGGITSSISDKNALGTKWIGEDGWVYVDRGKIEASTRDWIREKYDRGPIKAYESRNHGGNFLDGVRTRKPCICPAETAHRSITPGHLAYVSHALGRPLKWNAAKEQIKNDPEAQSKLMELPYRAPWNI